MVDKSKDNQLDSEIAKRLDDLFGENDPFSAKEDSVKAKQTVVQENNVKEDELFSADEEILDLEDVTADETDNEHAPDDYPLAELKNLVLSIDWEITEEALAGFLSQIDDLKVTYKNQKVILTFLQLLGSLGVYIKTNRGNAHPKTFKILSSVFSSLEAVVLSDDMTESEKKKLLETEMNKYRQLRNQVSKKKAAKVGRKEVISAPKAGEARLKTLQKKGPVPLQRKVPEKAIKKSLSPAEGAAQSYGDLGEAVTALKKFIRSELNALKQELRMLQKSK